MLLALTLVGPDRDALGEAGRRCDEAVAALGGEVKAKAALGPLATDRIVQGASLDRLRAALQARLAGLAVDACVQPEATRRKRLVLADMDSTLIGCECLDELADYAGVKAQVAAVTERAMRGEIDFEGALRARVAMLAGLPVEAVDRCRRERVRLNPGARTLGRTLSAQGVETVLVSGGFDVFVAPVAEAAGFATWRANRLLVEAGRLTGRVADPILGREAKRATLEDNAARLGVGLEMAAAIGDGANDLDMIRAAGLGVAYRAKPVVAAEAHARLDHADLTALLYFQGYRAEDFVD